jgi:triosephosphate isomerase
MKIIIGNWKMNKSYEEAISFVKNLKGNISNKNQVIICAPSLYIRDLVTLSEDKIKIGAQNMYFEEYGAFTGEISPLMLKLVGAEYVILGHSERRKYFYEDDKLINKKVIAALKHNLTPILCIGESLEERKNNTHFEKVKKQLKECLKNIDKENLNKIIIAYEPIWAIGTGNTATLEDAEEMCKYIRENINVSDLKILYGGSVTPDNIKGLLSEPNIDGVLVGGASLDLESFLKITNY